MPRRADTLFAQTTGLIQFNGGGHQNIVQTPTGVWYMVYCDTGSDLAFRKSTNFGFSWSNPVVLFTGSVTALSVYYDKWSGLSGGLIHCAYIESGTDDTLYRTIDTESSDALSTQTVIFAGASTAANGNLSIVRARGGNVYCRAIIDSGAEGGFFRLPNANVPAGAWDAARTNIEALASTDQGILVPGFAADNQDIMCMWWDASATELSRYIYDDSANTWAETSIATSMTFTSVASGFPSHSVAVDYANSQIILVAWSNFDAVNSDLRCWTITESAITEVTNVVLNSTDDQGLCVISLNSVTGEWIVFYLGKSDGSETFHTSVNIYCKGSKDGGTTWGAETKITNQAYNIGWLNTCPYMYMGNPPVAFNNDQTIDELLINIDVAQASTFSQLGL